MSCLNAKLPTPFNTFQPILFAVHIFLVTGNVISTLIFSLHSLNYSVLTHKLRVPPFSYIAHAICMYQCSDNDTSFLCLLYFLLRSFTTTFQKQGHSIIPCITTASIFNCAPFQNSTFFIYATVTMFIKLLIFISHHHFGLATFYN